MVDRSEPGAAISLQDSETCGENLAQMACRMTELAPVLCRGCAPYHIRYALTRYTTADKSIAVDRPFLIKRIRRILGERSRRARAPVEIVIAGASDTGMLASCAHAVATMGTNIQSGTRFTVIDRCGSPLALCREFASQHDLLVETLRSDLSSIEQDFDADLIVAHSLLRFLDRPRQIALLARFNAGLRPGGRVIVSQSIRPRSADHRDKEARRWRWGIAMANAAVAGGGARIADAAIPLLRRMDEADEPYEEQPGEIASIEELRHLATEAGLEVESLDVISKEVPLTSHETFARQRAVAILKSSLKT